MTAAPVESQKIAPVPFLDLRAHHEPFMDEFVDAFRKVAETSAFAGGPFVAAFEKEFASFCGTKHCVAVGNGTDALWLSLLALGIGPGDEVITVPNSFMATAEAISYCGAKPVFVDVDEQTCTMDASQLEAAITLRTRAIIPVHLYGQMADMEAILAVAKRHGLPVVEDACQAHGAKYKGKTIGTFGAMSCYSFYPGKNLGAAGEGGALVTNNAEFAKRARSLREHGSTVRYYHDEVGFNYRMEGIQGAVLGVKLPHLPAWTAGRQRVAKRYAELLKDTPLKLPAQADWAESVWHLYVVRNPRREELKKHLEANGVGCALHYPLPLHLQKCYAELGHKEGSFPVSEKAARECLSLPIYPELTDAQIQRVADVIKDFFKKN